MCYFLPFQMWQVLRNSAVKISLFVVLILTTSCASLTRGHGEEVFTSQHRAITAITEAIQVAELENPEIVDELYAAEDELNEACGPLQEVGSLKIIDKTVSFFLKLTSIFSLNSCEEKAREVEELIWRLDPETARYYLNKETNPY